MLRQEPPFHIFQLLSFHSLSCLLIRDAMSPEFRERDHQSKLLGLVDIFLCQLPVAAIIVAFEHVAERPVLVRQHSVLPFSIEVVEANGASSLFLDP